MLLELFIEFLKVGGLTIGGGYAMISIVKEICVEKKHWIGEEEFANMLTISESTPGPIAVNMATYIGYKKAGIMGAVVSTIAVVFIPMVTIYIFFLFIKGAMKYEIIKNAFLGIRIAVSIVIIQVAIDMIKVEIKNSNNKKLPISIFLITVLFEVLILFLGIHINTIYIIITGFIISFVFLMLKKL